GSDLCGKEGGLVVASRSLARWMEGDGHDAIDGDAGAEHLLGHRHAEARTEIASTTVFELVDGVADRPRIEKEGRSILLRIFERERTAFTEKRALALTLTSGAAKRCEEFEEGFEERTPHAPFIASGHAGFRVRCRHRPGRNAQCE